MKNESSFNYILIGFIVFVAVTGGYLYFTSNNTELNIPITSTVTNISENIFTDIGSIQLDTGIFSDPRFNALTNINVPITQEQMGRTDPFAPIH